jgi:hypothetical protein
VYLFVCMCVGERVRVRVGVAEAEVGRGWCRGLEAGAGERAAAVDGSRGMGGGAKNESGRSGLLS